MNQRMCEGLSDKKNECDGHANECGGQRGGKKEKSFFTGKHANTGMLCKSERFRSEGEVDGIIIPSIHQLISKSQYGWTRAMHEISWCLLAPLVHARLCGVTLS